MSSDIFWGIVPQGPYTLALRACVRAQRTTTQKEACGPIYYLEWSQLPTQKPQKTILIETLFKKRQDLDQIGLFLNKTFSDFLKDIKECPGQTEYKELYGIFTIQIQNALTLGPDFFTYAISYEIPKPRAPLPLPSQPTIPSQPVDPSRYDGFSLTDASSFLDPSLQEALKGGAQYFPNRDYGTQIPGLKAWEEDMKRLSSELAQDQPQQNSFQYIKAFFGLKPEAQYPCLAFNKAAQLLLLSQEEVAKIKNDIKEAIDQLKALSTGP
jgi:hypothetical protein